MQILCRIIVSLPVIDSNGSLLKLGTCKPPLGRFVAIDPSSVRLRYPTPILCFRRIHWHGRNDGLAEQLSRCARAIGAIAERLRFSGCVAVHRSSVAQVSSRNAAMAVARHSQVTPRPTPSQRNRAAWSCTRADDVHAKNESLEIRGEGERRSRSAVAAAPIRRCFTGQFAERGCKCSLRGVPEGSCD